ncbi:ABC multidrug transporter [Purpureocillium lavendulum]|uniref:ABC multidrug transporter n=1 Tax=Purpureocillium lavendulum TaxID=1247861 RepID=A0AB34FM68_9HYPO|nr:ABC multidrug transporter [Purpureocillium lavendulum]
MVLASVQAHLGRSTTAALVALPVAIPVVYLLYLNGRIRSSTTSRSGRRDQQLKGSATSETRAPADPKSLPDDVRSDDGSRWVVSYERVVSKPIPVSRLPQDAAKTTATGQPSALLRDYLRAAHVAFSWTPQAILIRGMIKEPHLKRSFDTDWISALDFAPGDLVNGIYRASYHGKEAGSASERSELLIEVPASYKGPSVSGLLVGAIELAPGADADQVIFVNETWMWRAADEPPTLLESPFGKWFHGKLAGWLILKGLAAVVGRKEKAT